MNCTSKRNIILSLMPLGSCLLGKKQISCLSRSLSHVSHSQVNNSGTATPKKKLDISKPFGQPTHESHPHRIRRGEIVPGITLDEFKLRRNRLIEGILKYCFQRGFNNKSLLIVIPSSHKKYMTEKIPYVFRQNSDFLYLTGCLEPDSILVLSFIESRVKSLIFLRGKDPKSELWDGPRTGVDQVVEMFGVDKGMSFSEFEAYVEMFLKYNNDTMFWYDYTNDIHPSIHRIMQQALSQTVDKIWESPKAIIHSLRLYKSPAEQELMKKSCVVASEAIKNAMTHCRPGDNEAFIQARIDFNCRMNGAEYLAYPPVVAAGDRANIIHYINNDQVTEPDDLVLVDAGCEYHGYCSDITRTWPISGKFSPAQRILYEVVYSVQTELIELCSEFPTLDGLYASMNRLLAVRLQEAGVVSSSLKLDDLCKSVMLFCPHHVSHYLGMDVHDTSLIPRNIAVQPGMVITIEPGVYIQRNNNYANPEFRGMGIRIEDDILVTKMGPYVLTQSCPKHIDDIESLRES